jgi:hypothetical protein
VGAGSRTDRHYRQFGTPRRAASGDLQICGQPEKPPRVGVLTAALNEHPSVDERH